MRERKYIKVKVNMYDDIKMKIIDRSPRRDLIHYIWSRTVVLAGKVNREGQLYMSKNIPYTIETLAIEFCREGDEVKLAFDLLIELEMVELMEGGIYIVKNFAKHQNIRGKEESKLEHKEIAQNKNEVETGGVSQKENIVDEKNKNNVTVRIKELKEEKINEVKEEKNNLEVSEKATEEVEQGIKYNDSSDKPQDVSFPILLHKKKTNRKEQNKKLEKNKKKNFEINDMEIQEDEEDLLSFYEGEFVLREGETIVREFKLN